MVINIQPHKEGMNMKSLARIWFCLGGLIGCSNNYDNYHHFYEGDHLRIGKGINTGLVIEVVRSSPGYQCMDAIIHDHVEARIISGEFFKPLNNSYKWGGIYKIPKTGLEFYGNGTYNHCFSARYLKERGTKKIKLGPRSKKLESIKEDLIESQVKSE